MELHICDILSLANADGTVERGLTRAAVDTSLTRRPRERMGSGHVVWRFELQVVTRLGDEAASEVVTSGGTRRGSRRWAPSSPKVVLETRGSATAHLKTSTSSKLLVQRAMGAQRRAWLAVTDGRACPWECACEGFCTLGVGRRPASPGGSRLREGPKVPERDTGQPSDPQRMSRQPLCDPTLPPGDSTPMSPRPVWKRASMCSPRSR